MLREVGKRDERVAARLSRSPRRTDAADDAPLLARAAARRGPRALHGGRAAVSEAAFGRVVERVVELDAGYTPPDFAHVPDPDAALFLCAVDHKAGYQRPHRVGSQGPFEGSELMWAVALAAGRPLRASALAAVTAAEVAECFRIEDETVAGPGRRAELWRDLAAELIALLWGRGGEPARRGGRAPRRSGRPARPAGGVSRLRRPAGEEGAAAGEDLRAPRLVRGRRSRELGGLGRQRADAPRAALRPGRARGLGGGPRGDQGRVQAGRRGRPRSRLRGSTTCSGSSAARTRTCSATRPATCASRRATPLRAGTRRPCAPRGNSRRSCG